MQTLRRILMFLCAMMGVGAVSIAAPEPAYACSCSDDYAEVKRVLARDDVVFAGKVLTVTTHPADPANISNPMNIEVTLEVYAAWKGIASHRAIIFTDPVERCGAIFHVGETYLVSAISLANGKLYSAACLLNHPLDNAWAWNKVESLGRPEWGGPIPREALRVPAASGQSNEGNAPTALDLPSLFLQIPVYIWNLIIHAYSLLRF
jgi:hypothetical protein